MVLSLRLWCLLGASVSAILGGLIATFLCSVPDAWLDQEHSLLLAGFICSLLLTGYLVASGISKRMLLIELVRSEVFLVASGCFTLVASLPLLVMVRTNYSVTYFTLFLLAALIGASLLRLGVSWRVFGSISMLLTIPSSLLLSLVWLTYANSPPDPVGGNGINAGILTLMLAPFAAVGSLAWLGAIITEKWPVWWYLLMALPCIPILVTIIMFIGSTIKTAG